MALFLIKRDFGRISNEELGAKASLSKKVCSAIPGVKWVRSYLALDGESKVTYCIYEAPDVDTVYRQAKEAGLPADEVTLLQAEISPATVN
jgi:hypothetical protein